MFKLNEDWEAILENELKSSEYNLLVNALKKEYENTKIYPPKQQVFNALNYANFKDIKIVILGQDPYHQFGQANGLSFSVKKGVKLPPSLRNIFKELNADLGVKIPNHGDLTNWAKQGVVLLNTVLTVEDSLPNSHKNFGWLTLTKKIITKINENTKNTVFVLWGKNAQNYEKLIDSKKHLILTAAHPSPFSARNGFFGCKHFSKANNYLLKNGKDPINWEIK